MIGKLPSSEKEEAELVNDLQAAEHATEKSPSSSPSQQKTLLSLEKEEPKGTSAVERHGQSRSKKAPVTTASPKPAPTRLTPEQRLVKLMEKHPLTWAVKDVGDWLEAFGYSGYRTMFIHHAISGAVFPRINDKVLKEELGIRNLGHREALTRAIADLLKSPPLEGAAAATTPAAAGVQLFSTPLSNVLSPSPSALSAMVAGCLPGVEILRAKEQHQRLTRDLDKAKARVESRKAASAQAARTAETRKAEAAQAARAVDVAVKEVQQLQVALKEAERHMAGRKVQKGGSTKEVVEVTFQERLEADLKARKAKRCAEQAQSKPKASTTPGTLSVSLEYLQIVLQETDPGSSLVGQPRESLPAALDEAAVHLSAAIDLSPNDVDAVKAAPSAAKKSSLLAAAARRALFMRRLNEDLTARTQREKEVAERAKTARAAAAQAAEERDLKVARKKVTVLGWPEESMADPDQLKELVNKAKALKGSKSGGAAADSQPGATAVLVELLAGAREDELNKVEAAKDARAKLLTMFRIIRAQEFLKTTESKQQKKAAKIAEAAAAGRPAKRVQAKEAGEAFLQRLAEDVDRRAKNREELAAKVEAEEKAKSESQKITFGKGSK